MTQKTYIVEGRQFRTEADYRRAVHDKEIIDRLRGEFEGSGRAKLEELKNNVHNGKYRFQTLLGQDFEDELEETLRKTPEPVNAGRKKTKTDKASAHKRTETTKKQKEPPSGTDQKPEIDAIVLEELKKQEKRRRLLAVLCCTVAVCCLGYVGLYSYYEHRTSANNSKLSELKDKPLLTDGDTAPVIHYIEEESEPREVLEEFKNLLNKNKRLIGWVEIDDTNINYPVMQTTDNEYYLDHNINQEYDKNGSVFMDKDCDITKPSTNFILYGHHMKSGQMFGSLDLYSEKAYFEEHPYIRFDTLYEKGTYQVMYVFRSRVYSEEEIVFKYYQFIDALSEQEFNSYMQEMAAMSLYDTGVTAQYGDHLLTLSTCDYKEKDGRFVVVARKTAAKE